MSKVEIEIPDDKWFRGEMEVRPQDKQLCVVIIKDSERVFICQYKKNNVFYILNTYGNGWCQWQPVGDYILWHAVDCWKPLGLPSDVNDRILAEVKKWVKENE